MKGPRRPSKRHVYLPSIMATKLPLKIHLYLLSIKETRCSVKTHICLPFVTVLRGPSKKIFFFPLRRNQDALQSVSYIYSL